MYIDVNFCAFQDAFTHSDRNENFTYDALRALFDYLEEFEQSTGEKLELDVIALCCEYSEMSDCEFRQAYDIDPERELLECDYVIAKLDNGHYLIQQH